MNRRQFLGGLAAGALNAQPPPRPNIIFILADDLGYGDVGCYGQQKIATPNIDRLAADGMRYTQVYAGAPVCAPSRCCLMTGMHGGHARIRDNRGAGGARIPLRPDDVTVAEVLKTAGYRTAVIGKWGLGEAGSWGVPNQQGFDEFFGFLNQDHALQYFPTHLWDNQTEVFPPGNQGAKHKQYVQDLFTKRALDFLGRSHQQPFFLYLAYTLPHADSELGRDTGDGYPVPDYEPYSSRDWPRPEKGFAATVTHLDRDVGRIVQRVRELGIDSNTVIFFSSDNGPAVAGGHSRDFFSSAGPLRDYKGSLYEGGIRVPMIARWPGRIPAGQVSEVVWAFWDFLPTAVELGGVAPPAGIDGISVVPSLLGRAPQRRHDHLYWESHGRGGFVQAVRMGDWKAVRSKKRDRPAELYDLGADIGETTDLSSRQAGIAGRIEELMREARTDSAEFPVLGE